MPNAGHAWTHPQISAPRFALTRVSYFADSARKCLPNVDSDVEISANSADSAELKRRDTSPRQRWFPMYWIDSGVPTSIIGIMAQMMLLFNWILYSIFLFIPLHFTEVEKHEKFHKIV